MRKFALVGLLVFFTGVAGAIGEPQETAPENPNAIIGRYCFRCHNDDLLTAGLTLESFDATRPGQNAELAEKVIHKLPTEMMPPPTAQRPDKQT